MFKIKIITIGKTKEAWLKEALDEYTQRLSKSVCIEWFFAKNDAQLIDRLKKETIFICLDLKGKAYSSEEFSTFLFKQLIAGGARLTFVIGGAEGLPHEIINRASYLLSFSRLTFTHQIMRLLFLEQMYRAIEINRGTDYHK